MTELEIINKCRSGLLKYLGFTCKEDEIIIDDFFMVGTNDEILHDVTFRISGGKYFSYYYNVLTGVFRIDSQFYDGCVVA